MVVNQTCKHTGLTQILVRVKCLVKSSMLNTYTTYPVVRIYGLPFPPVSVLTGNRHNKTTSGDVVSLVQVTQVRLMLVLEVRPRR